MHVLVYWSVNQHAASTSNPVYPHQIYPCNIFYCSNPRLSPQLTLERVIVIMIIIIIYNFIIHAAQKFKVLYKTEITFKKEYR